MMSRVLTQFRRGELLVVWHRLRARYTIYANSQGSGVSEESCVKCERLQRELDKASVDVARAQNVADELKQLTRTASGAVSDCPECERLRAELNGVDTARSLDSGNITLEKVRGNRLIPCAECEALRSALDKASKALEEARAALQQTKNGLAEALCEKQMMTKQLASTTRQSLTGDAGAKSATGMSAALQNASIRAKQGIIVMRRILNALLRSQTGAVFYRIRMHWDVDRFENFEAQGISTDLDGLSVSTLRCLLTHHVYRHESKFLCRWPGTKRSDREVIDWQAFVDTSKRMAILESLLIDNHQSQDLFSTSRSGLGFMRNMLENWERMDPTAKEIFESSAGSFFAFNAQRMRELQGSMRAARIDADFATLEQFQTTENEWDDEARLHTCNMATVEAMAPLDEPPSALDIAAMAPANKAAAVAAMSSDEVAALSLSTGDRSEILAAMTSQEQAATVAAMSLGDASAMSAENRAAALAAMSSEAQICATKMMGLTPEEKAATLATMSLGDAAAVLSHMPAGDREPALAAMIPEAKAAIFAMHSPTHEQILTGDQVRDEPIVATNATDQKALYKQIRKQVVAEERAKHEADLKQLEVELTKMMEDKALFEEALAKQRDNYEADLLALKAELVHVRSPVSTHVFQR